MENTQPRCPICRWPYRPDGCTPTSCCFRPHEHTAEHGAKAKRRAAYDRLREAGNPTPTLEDVDAELQPKGLQVLTLTEPVWLSAEWRVVGSNYRERPLLCDDGSPFVDFARVMRRETGVWHFADGRHPSNNTTGDGHPTPEAAQAACEAAIVAAWRVR